MYILIYTVVWVTTEKQNDWQIFDEDLKLRPTVVIKEGYKGYIYAVPLDADGTELVGATAGGSFIYTCDSRFRKSVSKYSVSLHDRVE